MPALSSPLTPALSDRCLAAFTEASRTGKPSAGARLVAAALATPVDEGGLDLTISESVLTPSGYSVDITVQYQGLHVAILVDAPDDYISLSPPHGASTITSAGAGRGPPGSRLPGDLGVVR